MVILIIMIILGFDISSTTTAYSVFNIEHNPLTNSPIISFKLSSFIKPIKTGSIISRIVSFDAQINNIIYEHKPDAVAIEDIIKFMKGKSSANTIITQATFNRIVCLASAKYLNREPSLYNVLSIRHGLKQNKTFPKKEDMPNLLQNHLKFKFPYLYNKNKKIKEESYDMADSIAVGLYHCYKLTRKN